MLAYGSECLSVNAPLGNFVVIPNRIGRCPGSCDLCHFRVVPGRRCWFLSSILLLLALHFRCVGCLLACISCGLYLSHLLLAIVSVTVNHGPLSRLVILGLTCSKILYLKYSTVGIICTYLYLELYSTYIYSSIELGTVLYLYCTYG